MCRRMPIPRPLLLAIVAAGVMACVVVIEGVWVALWMVGLVN